MKSISSGVCVVLLCLISLLLSGGAAWAESKELDRSKGSFAGWVWFIWGEGEGASAHAAVAIGRLPDARLERAYGLWPQDGKPTAGAIEVEKVSEIATEGRNLLAVKVGPRSFDQIRYLIYRWGHIEDHSGIPPAMACENLLDRVAREIGLKAPYRSALRSSQPISYLTDLMRINR